MKNIKNYHDIQKMLETDKFEREKFITLGCTAERILFIIRVNLNKINKKIEQDRLLLKRLH